jgi:hypothetical protein
MLLRILLVGAALVAALIVVKDHRVLQRMHITGYCETYAQAKDGGEWRACYAGHLEGRPSLELNGCKDRGLVGKAEVWRCPAPLAANEVRQ